jgi:hypothetical protein
MNDNWRLFHVLGLLAMFLPLSSQYQLFFFKTNADWLFGYRYNQLPRLIE